MQRWFFRFLAVFPVALGLSSTPLAARGRAGHAECAAKSATCTSPDSIGGAMREIQNRLRVISFLCMAISVSDVAVAHSSDTAAVRAGVTDASGGAIPGATVTVKESDRNVPHTVTTDTAGRYVVTALPPGEYTLSVELSGFKPYTHTNIPLAVQQQATFDVSLDVGRLTDSVEVRSQAPLLNTTISTLGQVIENRYMTALPNIGRNPLTLLNLTPGVNGAAGTITPTNTNFVANGTRNSTSDVLVDGAIVNTTEQNTGATDLKWTPSVDAVQEFKMQTNFFGAEYAQSGGAIINMVTKSGTNAFHGDGYDFLRDSNLNANSWAANRNGSAKPYYHRDQVGGIVGGPIRRNKTFFFATFEYTQSSSPSSATATVPTLEQRRGDFSQTFFSDGRPITIYNPFDTYADANGITKRRPFPGNVIPAAMLDPVVLRALQYYPKPNQDPNPITHVNNWFMQGIGQTFAKQYDLKAGHSVNNQLRVTARYSENRNNNAPPNLYALSDPALAAADPYNGPSSTITRSATSNLTFVQNAATLWTFTY